MRTSLCQAEPKGIQVARGKKENEAQLEESSASVHDAGMHAARPSLLSAVVVQIMMDALAWLHTSLKT